MIRITKGDITLECETQADVRLALGVFADVDEPPLPSVAVVPVVNGVPVGAPEWRVGGPPDPKPLPPIADEYYPQPPDGGPPEGFRVLRAVPTESGDSVQHVPVRALLLDVLNAIMLFPEGVETRGVAELLGLTDKSIGNRIQRLKDAGLVEKVPHHRRWRATQLARRAKLVKC
jgi:hypothetical protein